MAALDGTVTFLTSEYRPCYVGGKKALFHKWENRSEIVAPSALAGGHNGGVRNFTLGIVEFENGDVAEILPINIKFADNKIKEYKFAE